MPSIEYSFVASLDSLKIDEPLGSDWNIAADVKISTSGTVANKLMNSSLHLSIGDIEANEILSGKPFVFAVSEYPLEDTGSEAQMLLLNARLKIALSFCNLLWLLKDNSVNFDRGFLQYPYATRGAHPRFSMNSWTTRFSRSDGRSEVTKFSKAELRTAISMYDSLYGAIDSGEVSLGLTPGTAGDVDRLSRAFYFLQGARAMGDPTQKIANYCTAFEAIVSTSSTELAHQVSERVAILIGKDSSEASDIYRSLKKAYGTRSRLVHGDRLRSSSDQYRTESENCDRYLRRLIQVILTRESVAKALEQKPEQVNQFFLSLLFGASLTECVRDQVA